MSSDKTNSIRIFLISALFLAIVSVGINYATYERLSNKINENQIISERFQSLLQKSVANNSEKISFLSRQNTQPTISLESDTASNNKIIKQVNAQNKVIAKILEHHGSLQEEIARLKRQGSASDNISINTNPDGLYGDTGRDEIDTKPVTIEDLEQEISLANKQSEELNQKTEAVFQSQPQEGIWASQTNLEIVNALEKIRLDPKFSDLGVNNIDCRESMCKIELSHSDFQQQEEFELMFLLEVSPDQPITSTVITRPLADGGMSNTYYLSTN